ncbi:MAG: squalene--hopene cyclase [Nitrospiraceae bacterium]|nr:squalene--hopene cyclase [Nitrospiraceae bacterium]
MEIRNRFRFGKKGFAYLPSKTDTALTDTALESIEEKIPVSLSERVKAAIGRTTSYYLSEQHEKGYWWYELESNVTITSEYLMLLKFLGIEDGPAARKIANYLLKKQAPDGTWPIYHGGPGDLSTTVEAYFALKLAGVPSDAPSLRRARQFILSHGGAGASRVFTKIFLALFGEFSWSDLPSMPVEIMLMPGTSFFSIYSFSSWARATIVPLSIILDVKPVRPIPESARVRELFLKYAPPPPSKKIFRFSHAAIKKTLMVIDRFVKTIEGFPLRPLRAKGLKAAEKWIVEHQEDSGDWGGIQPPMVNSLIALSALGHDISNGHITKGLEALERFTIESGNELVLQSCISPVWDTALTSLAMLNSGLDKAHPALSKSCLWLASKQILKKGDWSVKRPGLDPGGWAFEFENNWYPDIDDTAVVLMFLHNYPEGALMRKRIEKGMNWVLGMQGTDGGWGAFDVDNDMSILNEIPFADLEAMIDPSTPDITGRVLELMGMAGFGLSDQRVRKAIGFIKKNQEPDGSFWGRWGVNFIYGTWSVLTGLASVKEDMSSPYVRKAVQWIKGYQNLDGGWGECCDSYRNYCLRGHGKSVPSQTAWAVLALIAAGEAKSEEVANGIEYLLGNQKPDGTWNEEEFTGTGFPKYFMIRYHNYRNCFPLMALGRFQSACASGGNGKRGAF